MPPLLDPFPDYLTCPHCGASEVEIWCYQMRVRCHACGGLVQRNTPACAQARPECTTSAQHQAVEAEKQKAAEPDEPGRPLAD